jgi:nitrate reductase cytochrome c-type subunit
MSASPARWPLLAALLAGGALLACAGTGARLSDDQISLRREGLLETSPSMQPLYALKEAGESKRLPRAYYGAPPLIPHSIAGMRLNQGTNECLDCHEGGDKDTPGAPPSHYIQALYRVRPLDQARHGQTTTFEGFAKSEKVTGFRYNCLQCHVTQATNAAPLVANTFTPLTPKDAHQDALEGLKTAGD